MCLRPWLHGLAQFALIWTTLMSNCALKSNHLYVLPQGNVRLCYAFTLPQFRNLTKTELATFFPTGFQYPEDSLDLCLSCGTERASSVLFNCHCVLCHRCARHLQYCPVCGHHVLGFIRIDWSCLALIKVICDHHVLSFIRINWTVIEIN